MVEDKEWITCFVDVTLHEMFPMGALIHLSETIYETAW